MSDSRDSSFTGNSNNGNACVVCYRDVEIYSIGLCEHPVCHECSTRMRVLCQQNECPICRQDLPKVVFTRTVKPFRHLRRSNLLDTRYNIYFDSLDIQERFTMLLAHACPICEDKQLFGGFNGLKDHMRRNHELHYCDLCVENLRIFSHERRCYTRSNLSQHRRKGDHDDKSHKGHPLCEFCDQRYMDNDELYRHLRRDHLYCHFCDADGLHHYYNSYDDLRDHFRNEHYVCEEDTCLEEIFTGVFRTDIDLKAHKACTHGKHLGKAAAKQARTLELEFTLAPRGDNRNNRRMPVGGSSGASGSTIGGQQSGSRRSRDYNNRDYNNRDYNNRDQQQQQQQQQHQHAGSGSRDYQADTADFGDFAQIPFDLESGAAFIRQPDVRSNEEFPSLGNSSPVIPNLGQSRGRGNLTIRGSLKPQTLAITDENFPALGPDAGISGVPSSAATASSSGISKTLNLSVFSSNKTDKNLTSSQRPKFATAPKVSIHVNHKTDGTVTTRVSGPNIRVRPTQRASMDCDFPALGRSNISANSSTISPNTGQWTKVTCVKQPPVQAPKTKKVAASPFVEFPPRLPSSDDFPSLSKPAGSKKKLSIAVVPQQSSWSQQQSSSSRSSGNMTKSIADATKGKAKKKKVKQQQSSGNNSSSNESTSSKTNTNITETMKKKKDVVESNVKRAEDNLSKNNGEGGGNLTRIKDDETMDILKPDDYGKRKESDRSSKKEKRKVTGANDDTPSADTSSSMSSDKQQSNREKTCSAMKNNTETGLRKRSELKIDGLNVNDKVYPPNEEFPSLGVGKSISSTTDNGRLTKKLTNPPPGFASATPPPPGFAVKIFNNERPTSRLNDSGLTFTNSSGEIYTILPTKSDNQDKIYPYTPPLDFQKRNKSLVARVTDVLSDHEAIQEFRYLSSSFRQGDCNAKDYYERCRRAMGLSAFENIFPEILVLLPDIAKQRELFEIHDREVDGKIRTLEGCTVCGQILKIGNDQRAHLTSHTMENHFPALGDTSNNTQPSTTWVVRQV